MATEQGTIHTRNRLFYFSGAALAILLVFAGFAKTYYMKAVFGTPGLTPLVHLHGLVMTAWFALFIVQTWLVASRKIQLHKRLGIFGAFLAVTLVVVGVTTAIAAARLGHSPGPPPLIFLVVPLADMLLFTILVGLGLALRARRETHRRLMMLGTLGILPAAVARIPLAFIHNGGLLMFFGLADLVVVAFVAYDTWKSRRLHPAFGWGALLIIASCPLRLMLASTHAWMQFALWVTR
ncbi:MAG TPA: hypothetical protein VFF76_08530 [Holophagaceae bacterium]|jgi:hypothetical protein|nr:hypothetical protein [Holophagaceae bacterium]